MRAPKFWRRLKAKLVYREAVKKADEAWARTRVRHYVMRLYDDDKLYVLNRKSFRILKRKRVIDKWANVIDLDRESVYATPYQDGKLGKYPEEIVKKKKEEWIRYVLNIKRKQ